jgi:hypothetical protein
MSNGAALLKWIVGTIIALIAAGGGATAWLDYTKRNHYWPFATEPYVVIERITVTQGDGTTIDPPIQVELSVNGQDYYYPKKTDLTQGGPRVRASQITNARIPVATGRNYYVTLKIAGHAPFNSSDHFSFPSDYPFSQVVTAHLFRVTRPGDLTATAAVDLTLKNK